MGALTQRTLRVFAVLEDCRHGSKDIVEALLPFFQPLLADQYGRVFDPVAFARKVTTTYGWNFSADIVEEIIPRFVSKGWLKSVGANPREQAYRVERISDSDEDPTDGKISETLSKIIDEFIPFIARISPLGGYSRSREEISDLLIEWLVSIDAYNEDVLKKNALQKSVEGTLGIFQELPDGSDLTSEDKYLCARFVKHLFEIKSEFTEQLCGIASAGLLTEVVRDFHKPVTHVQRASLSIYLDSTVALELLGVSGAQACANVDTVIGGALSIGCPIRVFENTLDEMRGALDGVLKRPVSNRTGPTADALRSGETTEAYVREVARNPRPFLETKGVTVISRTLKQFPGEQEYFDQDAFEACYSRITWHTGDAPRAHDATAIALIMRMRKGTSTNDIFGSKHVFVTRNGMLAQMARRFCIDEDLLKPNALPPVIHQRQLATALWLRTGDGISSTEIPRHMMLAACDQVLSVKRSMIDKVQLEARSLTKEKAEQLDLLLSQDRSVQMLQDKTLGVTRVVTAENIDDLIGLMKSELVSDLRRDADEKISEARKSADSRVRSAGARRKAAEIEAAELKLALEKSQEEDIGIIQALVDDVNKVARRERIALYTTICIVLILFAGVGLIQDVITGWAKWGTLGVSAVFIFGLAFMQIFDRSLRLGSFAEKRGHIHLNNLALQRGLVTKLPKYEIEWNAVSMNFCIPDRNLRSLNDIEQPRDALL